MAWLIDHAGTYWHARGDIRAALPLLRHLRHHQLGDDHPDTLTSVNNLALDLWELGALELARTLDEDTLTRRRHVLGGDDYTP